MGREPHVWHACSRGFLSRMYSHHWTRFNAYRIWVQILLEGYICILSWLSNVHTAKMRCIVFFLCLYHVLLWRIVQRYHFCFMRLWVAIFRLFGGSAKCFVVFEMAVWFYPKRIQFNENNGFLFFIYSLYGGGSGFI